MPVNPAKRNLRQLFTLACTWASIRAWNDRISTFAQQCKYIHYKCLDYFYHKTIANTHSVNEQDRKKTLKVTHQCCHGFARGVNADVYSVCEKIDLRPVPETAEKLGATEFMKMAKKNDLTEFLSSTNFTVFMPTDASLKDLSEDMLESVSQLNRSNLFRHF